MAASYKTNVMRNLLIISALLLTTVSATAKNLYIPVAGVAPGVNGTLFRTDVRLFNPSETKTLGVTLHFLPQGWDGTNIPGRVVEVGPRKMVVLNNVVQDFLQWPAPVVGAIRIDSDTDNSYSIIASSRTYTDSPNPAASGTYGQFVPAIDVVNAKHKTVVLHVSHSLDFTTGFRTNAGVMNPQRQPTDVSISLHRADGTLIGTAIRNIQGMSMLQESVAAMFGLTANVEEGFLVYESVLPVFTFASINDNRSGDGFLLTGEEDIATVEPLPLP